MTEKEKMLKGDFYNSRDAELIEMYHRARGLFQEYNRLNSTDAERRAQIPAELLEHKGKNVWIEPPFYCDYGENISIGDNTFVNLNCMFLDDNKIRIGKNGLIGPYVQIYTANHPLNAAERIRAGAMNGDDGATYLTATRPVAIGDNVWIGGNTVIMPGVSVGNNVTVGAGSVVTKDLPDSVLAYGNPCKVVRRL